MWKAKGLFRTVESIKLIKPTIFQTVPNHPTQTVTNFILFDRDLDKSRITGLGTSEAIYSNNNKLIAEREITTFNFRKKVSYINHDDTELKIYRI